MNEISPKQADRIEKLVDQNGVSYAIARSIVTGMVELAPEDQKKENSNFCGDCLAEIKNGSSCVHLVVDENGNSKIIG